MQFIKLTLRRFQLIVAILTSAILIWLGLAPAFADMTVLTYNIRFCPSWAEAHERSLADLNHGRPPYPVKWKGCIVLERGTCVDVVEQRDQSTEIVIRGKHWDHGRYWRSFEVARGFEDCPAAADSKARGRAFAFVSPSCPRCGFSDADVEPPTGSTSPADAFAAISGVHTASC
jgi:hypothetical protein